MKLILQCAVCGTNHVVGTTTCTTCRATGLQDLRLLFECPGCFAVGLMPRCQACDPSPPPPPYEVVASPAELARLWGVNDEPEPPPGGDVLVPGLVGETKSTGEDEFDLMLDEEAEHDADEEVRLGEGADITIEDE